MEIRGECIQFSPITFIDVDYTFEEEQHDAYTEEYILIAENGNKLCVKYVSGNFGVTLPFASEIKEKS